MRWPIDERKLREGIEDHLVSLTGGAPEVMNGEHATAIRDQFASLLDMKRDLETRLEFSESRRAAAAHNRMQERR